MKRIFLALLLSLAAVAGRADSTTTSTTSGKPPTVVFLNLGAPLAGNFRYCSNCSATSPCTGGGSGAFAYRVGSAWNCSNGGSGVSTPVSVANGGTGSSTLTANNVVLGNGTSAPLFVAPSTSGNVLTSNGTTWQSTAPAASGLTADGTTVGATSQSQVFTDGITTTATTGRIGVGTTAVTGMLDVSMAPAGGSVGVYITGTKPPNSTAFGFGTFAFDILGPSGGDSSTNSNNRFAGMGAGVEWTLGPGGDITGTGNSTSRGGTGGGFAISLGNGGNATGATGSQKGGDGGSVIWLGGGGGTVTTHAGIAGSGGSFSYTAGTGGDNGVSGGTAGPGGFIALDAGAAGVASGGASVGTNGTITIGGTNASSVTIGRTGSTNTIIKPVIADFTNATHNHSNAAAGGTIAFSALTGAPVALAFNAATTGNTAATETDIRTTTLTAGQLSADGQSVRFDSAGSFAGTLATNKRIIAYFGGTAILDSGSLAITSANTWRLSSNCYRDSSSSVKCSTILSSSATGALTALSQYAAVTGLTLSNTQVYKITGNGTNANDVTAEVWKVAFDPAP